MGRMESGVVPATSTCGV